MKTTMFSGGQMSPLFNGAGSIVGLEVPTLSAYAVEYAEFTPPPHPDNGYMQLTLGASFHLEKDRLVLHHPTTDPFMFGYGGTSRCRLVIHYYGIRNYRLLFPQVTDESLQQRLGDFYEEADRAFEVGAWLSFSLMAAAVYEGLLGSRLDNLRADLVDLIRLAHENDLINDHEYDVLTIAREKRNLVHASRHARPWVSRADAMDMRIVMDSLVRALSSKSV